VTGTRAAEIGLADELADDPDRPAARLLARLTKLPFGITAELKRHAAHLAPDPQEVKEAALREFVELFAEPGVRSALEHYVRDRRFPWETGAQH
jgi:polyketide biosynthesis enoyl-CoA hydratase PksH